MREISAASSIAFGSDSPSDIRYLSTFEKGIKQFEQTFPVLVLVHIDRIRATFSRFIFHFNVLPFRASLEDDTRRQKVMPENNVKGACLLVAATEEPEIQVRDLTPS